MALFVRTVRLTCLPFSVDARRTAVEGGGWLASADTPDGPMMGTGETPVDALIVALAPFQGVIDELLACLPPDLTQRR